MRIAFKMKVNNGNENEYERRHNPIWQELEKILLDYGVKTYSIFLDRETRDLFAYAEIDSLEKWNEIACTDICQKWWNYMSPLMLCNEDNSPVSKELREVFHLEKIMNK